MAETAALKPTLPALPGYWRFAWMFFMQPVSLHRLLQACGVDEPGISLWSWWRKRQALPAVYLAYFRRLAFLLAWPLAGLALAWAVNLVLGLGWSLPRMALGVVGGVAGGVALGVVRDVAAGVAGSLAGAFGVVLAAAIGSAYLVTFLVRFFVALFVAFLVPFGIAFGKAFGVAYGGEFGVALDVVGGALLAHV